MADAIVGAYILAGGQSSRFGSDKARALIADEPLLIRLKNHLHRANFEPVIAVVNDPSRYTDLPIKSITDKLPNLGPLGGLHTALTHTLEQLGRGWILLVPCDLLVFENAWCHRFETEMAQATLGTRAIALFDEDWLPFPAIYHTDLLPCVTSQIDQGFLSLRQLLKHPDSGAIRVAAQELPTIQSANTPDEWKRFLNSL